MDMLPDRPWKITDTGSAFKVVDAHGRVIAYFYYRREDALRGTYLPPEQARELAIRFARISKEEP